MKRSRIINPNTSKEIDTMKATWFENMKKIDKLYAEKYYLENNKMNKGLHMINAMIQKLATVQIGLDYKIQKYHMAKNEFLFHQFNLYKSNQL